VLVARVEIDVTALDQVVVHVFLEPGQLLFSGCAGVRHEVPENASRHRHVQWRLNPDGKVDRVAESGMVAAERIVHDDAGRPTRDFRVDRGPHPWAVELFEIASTHPPVVVIVGIDIRRVEVVEAEQSGARQRLVYQ